MHGTDRHRIRSSKGKLCRHVDAGLIGMYMYEHGNQFFAGDGIVKHGVEKTIETVGRLARQGMKATDEEIIRQVISIHQHGVENPEQSNNGKSDFSIHLNYKLKNGQLVQRQYYIDTDSLAAMTLQNVLSRPEVIFGTQYATAEALGEALYMAEVENIKYNITNEYGYEPIIVTDRAQLKGLVEALIADALAGNLCQHWEFTGNYTEKAYIYMTTRQYNKDGSFYSDHTWSITVTSKAYNTIAWLKTCE